MTEEREPGTVGQGTAEPETTEPTQRAPTFLDSDPDTTAKYGATPVVVSTAQRAETEVPTKVFEGPTAVFEKEPETVLVKKSSSPELPLKPRPETVQAEPAPKPSIEIVDEPAPATVRAKTPPSTVAPSRREAPGVYVVGFWKRLVAATVDLAIVIPAALLMTLIVSKIAGVHLPPSNLKLLDVDMWIDLVLATDPALVMGIAMFLAIGLIYLLVFQIVVGRTLGMRLLKMKIIDVYGERPSPARCVARCGGYLASVATLFLGFLWMGFDSEKRGLQDWIAGTYVIRA